MLHSTTPQSREKSRQKYLHRRPNSRYWQLRVMVPYEARKVLGRAEFTKSLGTTSEQEAQRLAYPFLGEWMRLIELASKAGTANDEVDTLIRPSKADIEEAALLIGYEEAGKRVDALIQQKARLGAAAYDALSIEFDRRHAEAVRNLHAGEQGYWVERARRQIVKRGWLLPEDSADFSMFADAIQRCGIDLFASARAKIAGKEGVEPSPYVRKALQGRKERAKAGEGILDLYDRYAAQRLLEGRKKQDSLTQDRKVVELFAEYVGGDRRLGSIEQREIREWRNAVGSLPIAYKKRKAFAGMSMREAVKVAVSSGEKGVSLNTVNKYLSAVSALFVWATREGHTERNPCDGLFYDVEKGKNPRPPFDAKQLNCILSSPLFIGFDVDGKEFKPGDCTADDWRYWIPLVGMFTGARVSEVAQLYTDDIRQDRECWYLSIRNDESRSQATKNKQDRIAPVHSMLQKIGFLSFVDRQRTKAGNKVGPLFPELARNERGHFAYPSRFWRTYLTRIGIKEGRDGFGSHSFRHGLADQLRQAGCLDNEVAVAIGHKQKTVTSGYGKIRQGSAARLSAMIEGATFEGVDFSILLRNSAE